MCGECFHASGQSGLHANSPVHNQSRNGSTPSGDPALRSAYRAKGLFQAIVRSWQIRDLIAKKEMGSITLGDLEKMSNSLLPVGIKLLCLLLHMHQDQEKTQFELFWTHIL